MYKILIVDDDQAVLNTVAQALIQEGYAVLTTDNARDVPHIVEASEPDLFLIDLTLSYGDGLAICRELRVNPKTAHSPVVFLTGYDASYSAAEALEAGGDDFIRKPFVMRELSARIRAHLRRVAARMPDDTVSLRVIPRTYQVFVDNREVRLTRVEFDLLAHLCSEPRKWYGTQELLTSVWNYPHGIGDTALVRNHIRNLRRKLEENPDYPAIIQSRHGRGYTVRARVHFDAPALR